MTVKSATDLKQHLELLETERALALDAGLGSNPGYMADLHQEITATRHAYVGSAVVEIASLRGQLYGQLEG